MTMATKQSTARVRLRHARARRDRMLRNWETLTPAQQATAIRYAARVSLMTARLDQ